MAETPSARELTLARKTVESELRQKPDNFIACRRYRHAWMTENPLHVEEVAQVGRRVVYVGEDLVCGRCGMERNDLFIIRKDGLEKIKSDYRRPAGYAMPGVPRGVKVSWILQQEAYRRAMEAAAQAEPGDREQSER